MYLANAVTHFKWIKRGMRRIRRRFLRATDSASRAEARRRFVEDLRTVASRIAGPRG
jgi:hypothetical protein